MFQQLIASSPSKTPRKPLTLVLSAIFHGFFIVLLIAVPLIHPESLANLQTLIAPPPPLQAPRRGVVQLTSSPRPVRPIAARPETLFAPNFIPPSIDLTPLETSGPTGNPDDLPQVGLQTGEFGESGRFPEGFLRSASRSVPLPVPPVTTAEREAPIHRIKRGGEVQHANLVRQVKPSYPHTAILMRVQGTVVLEAIIDRDGRVENLKVISGHPLLIKAASEAVEQWRYRPTLLNGQPVEVLTQVTVNLILEHPDRASTRGWARNLAL
jgi:periplasmic protein TonB